MLYITNYSRNIFSGQPTSHSSTSSPSPPWPLASGTSGFVRTNNPSGIGQSSSGSSIPSQPSFLSRWPSASCGSGSSMNQTSSKNKLNFRFQPYKVKETWTHDFCVLANKDQHKVPTTSMKQELREAGLGQRSIVFKNKKGNFGHIQEVLYNHYPKLKEAGGFEFYRQGTGKGLSYIKPPASGYTIPYLKYEYGIKSAILYVLPIQRNLSMEHIPLEEEKVQHSDIVEEYILKFFIIISYYCKFWSGFGQYGIKVLVKLCLTNILRNVCVKHKENSEHWTIN